MTLIQKLLIVFVWLSALTGCSHFPCDAHKVSDAASPNHRLTATVVQVGCGAMAKDATWVTVHRTGQKYDDSNDIVFSVREQRPMEVSWSDDRHLNLFCRCRDEDVHLQIVKRGDISISYK